MPYNYSQYQPQPGTYYQQTYYPTNYSGQGMQTAVPMNQMQPQQTNVNNQNTIVVQRIHGGEQAVVDYPLAPGATMIFMDDDGDSPVMFIKSADSLGRARAPEIYDLVKRNSQIQQPQIDMSQYVKRSDLESMVQEMVNKALEQ